MENNKYIEFVTTQDKILLDPKILMVDVGHIKSFEMTNDPKIIRLTTINESYYLIGTYRTLTNRFYYALNKKNYSHEDEIIRPSIRVLHKKSLLEPDVSFMDESQLKGFIDAFKYLNDDKLLEISAKINF